MDRILTEKGFKEYKGQYEDKYYLLHIRTYRPFIPDRSYIDKLPSMKILEATVYDATKNKTKTVKVRKNQFVRINNKKLNFLPLFVEHVNYYDSDLVVEGIYGN